jgi:anthranilate phosphoribosyltransferase
VLDPGRLGVNAPLSALAGGDAAENAAALESILAGERSPRADVVALNAGLALVIAERAGDLNEGLDMARESIASGAARTVFEAVRRRQKT